MHKPRMLWFDCTSANHHLDPRKRVAKFFDVVSSMRLDKAAQEIANVQPKVLCFDFDYPDQARLGLMQTIKREHMRLPILMLTVEHSEALAVWAFRARVWNYLVKPVSPAELDENLKTLVQIVRAERRFARAVPLPDPGTLDQLPANTLEDPHTLLRPAIYYIEQHFNEKVSADEVARLCGLTRYRLSRLFRQAFGVTFQEYLIRHRIVSACQLLQRPSVSVTDVGYAVGFNDASYFTRMFKRCVGVLPSEYASSPHQSIAHILRPPGPSAGKKLQVAHDFDPAEESSSKYG